MVELTFYKYNFFKKKEVWFFNGENIAETNYTTYCYFFVNPFGKIIHEKSCFIDLNQSIEIIKNNFSKTTKLHINRAIAANISCSVNFEPSIAETKKFVDLFSKFAKEKKIDFNTERIYALQKINRLVISYALISEAIISIHCYLHDNSTVVLLHTFNIDPDNEHNGIANKLLHWEDIKAFKEKNIKLYDFGGIDPEKLPGITAFKLSFGAETCERLSAIKTKGIYKLFQKIKP